VPYPPVGETIVRSRTQSDLPPVTQEKQNDPVTGFVVGSGSGEDVGVGAGTDTGTDIGTGTGTSNSVGKNHSLNFQKIPTQKRQRQYSGTNLSTKTNGGFPSVYFDVRKTREKSNPYIELPTVEGN
jgi:hypothetical protein